jgi:RNA polymerase sigma-70 factor (ECF subfamily)
MFYELIRPYQRSIFLTALAITGNQADAEEVVQEAVMKAFLHLRQFRGEARFSTWLVRITANEARALLRRQRRWLYDPMEVELPDGRVQRRDFPDPAETPAERLERQEIGEVLHSAVALLPPKYGQVFVMRDLQQLSIRETARQLGLTRSTVKARLWRARLRLRRTIGARITVRPRRPLTLRSPA